jgi:hypothetical protein
MKTLLESPLIPKPTITDSEIDLSGERAVNDRSSADGVKSVYTISILVFASASETSKVIQAVSLTFELTVRDMCMLRRSWTQTVLWRNKHW